MRVMRFGSMETPVRSFCCLLGMNIKPMAANDDEPGLAVVCGLLDIIQSSIKALQGGLLCGYVSSKLLQID